jgi:23S rRNA (uracil1939-C5)-methyltransferase
LNALCRHFGTCGGCTLQDLSADAYVQSKRKLILDALERHGLDAGALREIVSVPPNSRRRATLKVEKRQSGTCIGFHAQRSHDLVDIRECLVLTPRLFAGVQCLRPLFDAALAEGDNAETYVLDADNGIDVAISWKRRASSDIIAQAATLARGHNIIRITAGRDLLYESATPEIRLGKAVVHPPPNAFLQPTREGEGILQQQAIAAIGKAKRVADLFCGLGTLALPLAERAQVHAVDSEAPLLQAFVTAARTASGLKPVTTERRDLFKHPLEARELNRFDAVILDPPRAGTLAQATQLAKSTVKRVAYVSCDAASFARDARVLVDGGFGLDDIVGVDQFLWSAHIELAAAFTRN